MKLKEMCERRGALAKRATAIVNKAESENRGLTVEEKADFDRAVAEDNELRGRMDHQKKVDSWNADLDRPFGSLGSRIGLTNASSGPTGDSIPGFASNDSRPPALFRNQATGEIVRGLRHCDSMANNSGFNPQFDDDRSDERIDPLDAGEFLRCHVTGRFTADQRQRYMNFSTGDGSGGLLLTPEFAPIFLDLARAAMVCSNAGALTVPVNAAEIIIAALASDPVSTWRHPGTLVPSSDATLSRITLHPRTLACCIPTEIELLEDAPNASQILANSLARSMALGIDQAGLGVNAPQPAMPVGLLNTTGINTISGVGTPTNYTQIGQAVTDILTANYPGNVEDLAWVRHPRDGETYDKLQDTLNQPLRPTPLASKVQALQTTSLSITQGGGAASTMVVGDFSQMLIGMRSEGVRIRILESGYFQDSAGNFWEAATSLQRLIIAYVRVDVAILRPTWFTALTGVTNT